MARELKKLADLKTETVLTDAEYQTLRTQIIDWYKRPPNP